MEVLFIKFNFVDMLNQYLTNIYMLKNNLYNLYFNIKGINANIFHERLKNDILEVNKMYLQLGNEIKKIGGYPILKLEEIKNISTIKEIASKNYNIKEARDILLKNLNLINNMNNQVGEFSIKNHRLITMNQILPFNKYLQDAIWSLEIDID